MDFRIDCWNDEVDFMFLGLLGFGSLVTGVHWMVFFFCGWTER